AADRAADHLDRRLGPRAGQRHRLAAGLSGAAGGAGDGGGAVVAGAAAAAKAASGRGGGAGMTMSLYSARRFLTTVGMVFLIFFGILLLIDMIEQMRRLSGTSAGLADAFRLSLLNVPDTLYRILPLILIMGSVALFLALARS